MPRLATAWTLVIAAACGCALWAGPPGGSKPAQGAESVTKGPGDVPKLKFESPDCERRFKALRAFFAERARKPGWDHIPIRELGNFFEESWCFPPEAGWNCFSGYAREKRRTLWYEVSTLFYDSAWPTVFGLNVSAGNNAREADWGAQLFYSVQGKGVVGQGLALEFLKFEGEEIKARVHLGTTLEYKAEATSIRVSAPGDGIAELALYYASPASFRDTALAREDALIAEVERAFKAHEVLKRVYGEYKGRGIPPMHEDVPLTPDEEKAALEKARRELAADRQAIEKNGELFHRLLTDLIPIACWK
jgi:hypothetical protein